MFGAATQKWLSETFATATPVQTRAWKQIDAGHHTLMLAPTGSGKTLAAFLSCIDRLHHRDPAGPAGVRVIYVSPLKALAYDIERNLRLPLEGIARVAQQIGEKLMPVRVSVRTGDTSAADRRRMLRDPGEILITTPESLYLMLGGKARELLRHVETVIVDEIHALAPGKRGAHLALTLERLAELCDPARASGPQRIGLSATQKPLDEVARFLGGSREVSIVDASEKPRLDLTIEVPTENMEHPERVRNDQAGIWPAIHPRLLELVRAHHSTIIFVNSRRLCERLAQRINELDGGDLPLVRAHHGSIAREMREQMETQLKSGNLRGIVATSSLELGIDMGAVDLVIQVESPGGVSRGLQRIGRAGHTVGARSVGRIFPKFRGDLLEAAVVGRRMLDAEVESIRVPQNPLDVLAQQIVAMSSVEPISLERLLRLARATYSFHDLTPALLRNVLEMLAGHYPSDAFADLRPRIIWDRDKDEIVARKDARLIAIANAGTIPDRGLYHVYFGEGGKRIGELDEEMVHETRVGETFLLGASTWRITSIDANRVIVDPAPGEPGRMPFWHGEGPGRPAELGRALGKFVRELGALDDSAAMTLLRSDYNLDPLAAHNLLRYVREEQTVTGTLPSDRSIVIERFRDELGDFRVCILSPFGARVHAPWGLAISARLSAEVGFEVQTLSTDDGIALRFADTETPPPLSLLLPDPNQVEELVLKELRNSEQFATHFRENAARALLLPRRRPGSRMPLWSQRRKSQALLAVASQHPQFPIVLETYRECVQDVFDMRSLVSILGEISRREISVTEVETPSPSPFARGLAFSYVMAYIYDGDVPLAERKAQALTLDRGLLRELLGDESLKELLEPTILDQVEAELQALAPERRVRSADGLHDLLRRIGDLSAAEIASRADGSFQPWIDELLRSRRAIDIDLSGESRFIAIEDFARYRDALAISSKTKIPDAYLATADAPLDSLLMRFGKSHAIITAGEISRRFSLPAKKTHSTLTRLVEQGKLLAGEFRSGAQAAKPDRQYCDPTVLGQLRRRTLAHLRKQIAPVESEVLGRFLPHWHGLGNERQGKGLPRLRRAIEQLEGVALSLSELERSILPARVEDFTPRMLDELGALGEIVWVGRGALGQGTKVDGRIALYRRSQLPLLLEAPADIPQAGPLHAALLDSFRTRGASFFAELEAANSTATSGELLGALWDLVWAGLVTNDSFQPLRALLSPRPVARKKARGARTVAWFHSGGRWSLVPRDSENETVRAHAWARLLLDRYGIVSREVIQAESPPSGFSALSSVLRAMEESGKVRRGLFVEGLSGAQFAEPGAVERLRADRDRHASEVQVLAAVDPANPYGALIPWPAVDADAAKPRRSSGARVVLVRGSPAFYLEPGGHKLTYFVDAIDEVDLGRALTAVKTLARGQKYDQLRILEINGVPALRSRHSGLLERSGFRVEPNGLVIEAT